MIDRESTAISIRKQCDLLNVNRSRLYYIPAGESEQNLQIMRWIDKEFTKHPFTGVCRMRERLYRVYGVIVNHKRIRRLMRKMLIIAIYPKPRKIKDKPDSVKSPCLIRGLDIRTVDHVWCSDITYIPMRGGFMYLAVVMDYYSRYVLSWSLSNSLEPQFCVETLDNALSISKPVIFHSDKGSQYTCKDFVEKLEKFGIDISLSGTGCCFDNILNERLWRTTKQEEVYLRDYIDGIDANLYLKDYFDYYNNERPHMSLGYRTPREVYFNLNPNAAAADSLRLSCGKTPLSESSAAWHQHSVKKGQQTTLLKVKIGLENG